MRRIITDNTNLEDLRIFGIGILILAGVYLSYRESIDNLWVEKRTTCPSSNNVKKCIQQYF